MTAQNVYSINLIGRRWAVRAGINSERSVAKFVRREQAISMAGHLARWNAPSVLKVFDETGRLVEEHRFEPKYQGENVLNENAQPPIPPPKPSKPSDSKAGLQL